MNSLLLVVGDDGSQNTDMNISCPSWIMKRRTAFPGNMCFVKSDINSTVSQLRMGAVKYD